METKEDVDIFSSQKCHECTENVMKMSWRDKHVMAEGVIRAYLSIGPRQPRRPPKGDDKNVMAGRHTNPKFCTKGRQILEKQAGVKAGCEGRL